LEAKLTDKPRGGKKDYMDGSREWRVVSREWEETLKALLPFIL
jgi:hypothetical protein